MQRTGEMRRGTRRGKLRAAGFMVSVLRMPYVAPAQLAVGCRCRLRLSVYVSPVSFFGGGGGGGGGGGVESGSFTCTCGFPIRWALSCIFALAVVLLTAVQYMQCLVAVTWSTGRIAAYGTVPYVWGPGAAYRMPYCAGS